jgi:hypothetical protein
MRRHSRHLIAPIVILAVGFGWGCGNEWTLPTDEIPESPFLPRSSPENLLANLKAAYADRNLAEYESLLALKLPAFTAVRSQGDQAQPGMPDEWSAWGRQTEIDIHRLMFDTTLVKTLTLDYTTGEPQRDAMGGMWSIAVTNVNLRLYGTIPGQEDQGLQELKVEGGTSRFWFREESWNALGTGDKVWKIVMWEDRTPGGLRIPGQPTSWSEVKRLYR